MRPLTLAEVNAAARVVTSRIVGGRGFAPYDSADEPYHGFLRVALDAREPGAWERLKAASGEKIEDAWGEPIGFVIARVNRILALIPEPE